MSKSEELFARALPVIPGGVNSPVRACGNVGMGPRFIRCAKGSVITDADGREYIDFIGSWGPMILGHCHEEVEARVMEAVKEGLSFGAPTEREVEMAELICSLVPSIEMVRMVNSGTEAVMSAVRTARGFTGRDKIVKFDGCYHGHSDAMLVAAGSGLMTQGQPDSAGVPKGCTEDTLSAIYNDAGSVEKLFAANPGQIAAVIVEPVGANMGVVPPKEGFLQALRRLCTDNGALLIFDEVITGFRLGIDGAEGYFGVTPDMTTFGKIIGGGMPVGAYGGRKEIMSMVAPSGPVYQAGTLSGNPVAMAAGIAQLQILSRDKELYKRLNETGAWFYGEIENILKETGAPCIVNHAGSLGSIFFTPDKVENYVEAKKSDTDSFARYYRFLLDQGIYAAPSQFEAMFLSCAHTREQLTYTLEQIRTFFKTMQ